MDLPLSGSKVNDSVHPLDPASFQPMKPSISDSTYSTSLLYLSQIMKEDLPKPSLKPKTMNGQS